MQNKLSIRPLVQVSCLLGHLYRYRGTDMQYKLSTRPLVQVERNRYTV
jgi:hypothetical protein